MSVARFRIAMGWLVVLGAAGPVTGQWPQYGGPSRDFVATVTTPLADTWPAEGPKKLWNRELGGGYSGIAVEDGIAYTMHRLEGEDAVLAVYTDTGMTAWSLHYPAPPHKDMRLDFGEGPNATPLVAGDFLVTIGFTGQMWCMNRKNGDFSWTHDLVEAFGGKVQEFGYSASPLLYKGRVVTLVGGDQHGVIAFNLADGSVGWASDPYDISYASPIVVTIGGRDQIVFMSSEEVIGLDAATGKLVWRHGHVNQFKNNCATPIWCDKNRLLISSHADGGTRLLQLKPTGGAMQVSELWHNRKIRFFHANAIRIGDYLYGCSGDSAPTFFAAVHIPTGKIRWRERGFPKANAVRAVGKLILLDEKGTLSLVSADPEKLTVHAQAKLLDEVSWTPPTLVDGALFIRDKKKLMALDVSAARNQRNERPAS